MKKKYLFVVVMLLSIVLVGWAKESKGGSSKNGAEGAKEAVNVYLKAYENHDWEKICKTTFPDYIDFEYKYEDLNSCINHFNKLDSLENIEYEIIGYEEADTDDYNEIGNYLIETFNYSEKKLGNHMYIFESKLIYKYNGEKEEYKCDVWAIQYDGIWYAAIDN